jgi:putative aldouronate transport system permease protein
MGIPKTAKNHEKFRRFKRCIPMYFMVLPGIIYFFINNYIPMAGIIIAFKNINWIRGILGSKWVGLSNFEYLFKTKDAWIITRNTLGYNFVFIVLGTVLAITVAILLNEIRSKKAKMFFQTIILLPYLISIVVVSYLVYAMLSVESGFINKAIFGFLGKSSIQWYSEPKYWPAILIIVHIWKTLGYNSIIYFASIVSIDHGYYEAAVIDGASRWQQIRYITIPCLTPVIITLTLFSIGRIFYSDFGLFYQVPMDAGPLYDVTNTIDTYVYRGLIKLNDIGMSSAAGVYQSLVGFLLVMGTNYVVSRIDKENSLF